MKIKVVLAVLLAVSIFINIAAGLMLFRFSLIAEGKAASLYRIITYHFLREADDGRVTIFHGGDEPDESVEIDGWTITIRSMYRNKTEEQILQAFKQEFGQEWTLSQKPNIAREQKMLTELTGRNNSLVVQLAGYLLLNGSEEAGMQMLRLVEQKCPDYMYLGYKYKHIISQLNEAAERLLDGDTDHKHWFEDLAGQHEATPQAYVIFTGDYR